MSKAFRERVVRSFARAMRVKLDDNEHKGDAWRQDPPGALMRRVHEELGELAEVMLAGKEPGIDVTTKAADVANMLMMVADAYSTQTEGRGLDQQIWQDPDGKELRDFAELLATRLEEHARTRKAIGPTMSATWAKALRETLADA